MSEWDEPAKLREVCGYVHRALTPSVHAPDAAGDEDGDAGAGGEEHGGGDGGCSGGAAGDDGGDVAARHFGGVASHLRQTLEVFVAETDARRPIHDGDGGGNGAMRQDRSFIRSPQTVT